MHRKHRKKLKKVQAAWRNLPEEILVEIFVRLPTKSLSRFRCVSNSLRTIIASSAFINMHHNNMKSNPSIIFASSEYETIYSMDYKSVSSVLPSSSPTSSIICNFSKYTKQMKYPLIPECYVKDFLCSCDGWLCISCLDMNGLLRVYLWNPLTKENKRISRYTGTMDGCMGCVYGLGYDYRTGNYKLVRIDNKRYITHSRVDIYSVRSDSWKSRTRIPYGCTPDMINGVLLNGAIHWLMYPISEQNSRVLVSFDIVHEIFKEMAFPEKWLDHVKTLRIQVGALGGCLCLTSYVSNVQFDVWVMQNYGIRESWVKSFTITEKNIVRNPYLELIWSFRNNEILLWFEGGFIFYDPKNQKYRSLLSNKFKNKNIVAGTYVSSLVPLM